jgi:hypothetical protein
MRFFKSPILATALAFQFITVQVFAGANYNALVKTFTAKYNTAQKSYNQDVGLFLTEMAPEMTKKDREYFIGEFQKYFAQNGVQPEFLKAKQVSQNKIVLGNNQEFSLELVNLEKAEFLVNNMPFTYKSNMPFKYNATVIQEILKASKNQSAWNLIPTAHAFEISWGWLLGGLLLGVAGMWFFNTKTGEKVKNNITPATKKDIDELNKKVDSLKEHSSPAAE